MPKRTTLRSHAIGIALVCAITGGTVAASVGSATAAPAAAASAQQNQDLHANPGQGPITPVPAPYAPKLPKAQKNRGLVASPRTSGFAAPKLTRSEVINRAQSWVGLGLKYNQDGWYEGYRMDCSGYASMAWNLGDSLTTPVFTPGVAERISKDELKAGDALLNPKPGNDGHIVLFEKWADDDHSSYWGYDFSGSGVHHKVFPYAYYANYDPDSYFPIRNKSVIDDITDPGMTNLTAGDFNGDGKKDLVAAEVKTGKLFSYPGTGTGRVGDRVEIGKGGWNGMKDLTVADMNKDGKDDLIATEISTGKLFLYPGNGSGLGDRVEIGRGGWNGLKDLFTGDFNGDGKKDIGATEIDTGKLYLYPGTGNINGLGALGDRIEIGNGGWNGMNKLVSPGDVNKDGKDDLVATEISTGKLYLYAGNGNGVASRVEIGNGGWNGISDYAGADFNGDGIGDLAAVESEPGETGKLYFYPGTGNGRLGDRTEIGNGGW
ncbi:hypothetical protein GCM10010218_61980 [Streptomyces mashuensis]|uniref:Uncharacterized protein n=1 Tax=Streptomyces mashuensis TaxID=33904 RepID=A0A919BAH3_9ACTN|nr:VCBS repeat-containing protein [Streptomyces mashuensis]GHF72286.1 hypothetical protein GCM10010218_61980 [Streptomyces mashuensis]